MNSTVNQACCPNSLPGPWIAQTGRYLALVTLALTIVACSWGEKPRPDKDELAAKIFETARHQLHSARWNDAEKTLKRLIARYPFGERAQEAQLELAYAYYKQHDWEQAISACDKFIRTYPRHKNLDYAFYLKGLVLKSQDRGVIARLTGQSRTANDQTSNLKAFNVFKDLLRRFPDSQYSRDARQRMVHLRNLLAGHAMEIADFYLRREAYVAAINRAKDIMEDYPNSPSTPDALALMVKCYRKIGMDKLAADSEQVLALNYPNYKSVYDDKDDAGLLSFLWPFD